MENNENTSNNTVSLERSFNDIIPNEIDSEIKLNKWFSVTDALFVGIYIVVFYQLTDLVHPYLKLVYLIFLFVSGVLLAMKSHRVPDKRNYMVLYSGLRRDRKIYHPIEYNDIPNGKLEYTQMKGIIYSAFQREVENADIKEG